MLILLGEWKISEINTGDKLLEIVNLCLAKSKVDASNIIISFEKQGNKSFLKAYIKEE